MEKTLLTRKEFEEKRIALAEKMVTTTSLQEDAFDLMHRADEYMWLHQSNFMGEPILNTAQDIMAAQEIIYKTKPKYIIEVGVAWAGMLLFYSTLMEILGGEKIIAIDIYIPDDLKERINAHEKLASRIEWIKGSSYSEEVLEQVRDIVGDCKDVMIHLDSNHTHDHVLNELKAYESFVGKDNYLICGDTIIDKFPAEVSRKREWGPGNSPMSALHEFMKGNDSFERDLEIENKLLFTCHPEGYLKRVK